MEKPIAIRKTSEEEVELLSRHRGVGSFKWVFSEETFNGEWWAIEVPNNKVASALNSYRNQCESVYKTRANIRRGVNGELFVRRLVDQPKEPRKVKGANS